MDRKRFTVRADLPGFLGHGGTIPPEILITPVKPDIVLISKDSKDIVVIKLTSPSEPRIGISRAGKSSKYAATVQDLKDLGYEVKLFTIEVSARGILSKENRESVKMITKLSRDGTNFQKVCKNLSKIAVISSYFIFLSREEKEWTKPSLITI